MSQFFNGMNNKDKYSQLALMFGAIFNALLGNTALTVFCIGYTVLFQLERIRQGLNK